MRTLGYILLFALCFGFGCKETAGDPPKLEHNDSAARFEVLWSNETKIGFLDIDGIHEYKNTVIMFLWKGFSEPSAITSFNKLTGDILWSVDVPITTKGDPQFYLEQDKVIFTDGGNVTCLSAQEGLQLWQTPIYEGARIVSSLSLTNGRLFCGYQIGDKWAGDSCLLFELNIESGKRSHVFTLHSSEISNYSPNIEISKLYTDKSGDDLLIFQVNGYDWNNHNNTRFDVLAFNVSADSLKWHQINLSDIPGKQEPVLENNVFIARGSGRLFAFDAETGESIWAQSESIPKTGINRSNIIYHDNRLVVNPGNMGIINVISLSDGRLLYSENNAKSTLYNMFADENFIYYTNLVYLYCHDKRTAAFQWKFESPFSNGNFASTGWIDPETDYMYISDSKRVMCLKLNF